MGNKPHCYGQMNWVLKYPENSTPSSAICSCQYTNNCLRFTRNKQQKEKELSPKSPKEIF